MRIAFGADHAGVRLKDHLLQFVRGLGHDAEDMGVFSDDRVDYPDYAIAVAQRVQRGEVERGLLVCASGVGMSIAANRFRGVRAVVAMNSTQARLARAHNDANVLCVGERLTGPVLAEDIVLAFLGTPHEGGRHRARIEKLDAYPRDDRSPEPERGEVIEVS